MRRGEEDGIQLRGLVMGMAVRSGWWGRVTGLWSLEERSKPQLENEEQLETKKLDKSECYEI